MSRTWGWGAADTGKRQPALWPQNSMKLEYRSDLNGHHDLIVPLLLPPVSRWNA